MYVVIDGIDGTGKTELASRLVPPLLRRGHSVSSFRSPTDKFLRKEYARLATNDPFAAALCFAVDRAMLRPEIEAALLQGDVVIQDRSYYSALAYLSAIASGMMALMAIVFSIAYITVQFNAIAYSPRLALWFANDPRLFHALGLFMATFLYALGTIAWVDRGAGGGVPLFSALIVMVLLVTSTLQFARLVRGLAELQISNTLHLIGARGRKVIKQMFPRLEDPRVIPPQDWIESEEYARLGPPAQTLRYAGEPAAIAKFDIDKLVDQARRAGAIIEMVSAVGDTVLDQTELLNVFGKAAPLPEAELLAAIHLAPQRTFEQDPKYPIRLLVDIAIKALSPAINDPTTAVQAIDEIEDLLRHLGRRELGPGVARDSDGNLRLAFPTPSWEDYLRLAFDEIRQFGGGSVQVMRRLRSALRGVAESVASESRTASVERYLKQLDLVIDRSALDAEDRLVASQEDRQGLGLSRKRHPAKAAPPKDQAPPEVTVLDVGRSR
jgi:uncharacterized membrane protein